MSIPEGNDICHPGKIKKYKENELIDIPMCVKGNPL